MCYYCLAVNTIPSSVEGYPQQLVNKYIQSAHHYNALVDAGTLQYITGTEYNECIAGIIYYYIYNSYMTYFLQTMPIRLQEPVCNATHW